MLFISVVELTQFVSIPKISFTHYCPIFPSQSSHKKLLQTSAKNRPLRSEVKFFVGQKPAEQQAKAKWKEIATGDRSPPTIERQTEADRISAD